MSPPGTPTNDQPSRAAVAAYTHVETTPVVVFDLASLRFRMGPGGKSVSVTSATGEHLGFAKVPAGCDSELAAHKAIDEAMRSSTVLRTDGADLLACRVGFYNPFTYQVAADQALADAGTVSVCAFGVPVDVPSTGLLTIHVGDQLRPVDASVPTAHVRVPTARDAVSSVAAHCAA